MDGAVGGNRSAARGPSLHPLLGSKVTTALETRLFESRLSDRSPKYLADHKVQGSVVVPGAAYLEMALAAGKQVFGPGRHVVEDVAIQQPMFLNAGVVRTAQTSVSAEMGGQVTVEIYSSQNDEDSSAWTMHACGRIRHGDTLAKEASPQPIIAANVRESAIDVKTREEIYELIAQRGLAYGPMFQVLGTVHRLADQAVADVEVPEATAKQLRDYDLHPALLDGMLQMMASIVPLESDGNFSPYTYMPSGVRRLRMHGDLTERMTVYARRTSPTENVSSPDNVIGDVMLLDADGNVLVELLGVRIQRVGRQKSKGQVDARSWLYEINWQPQPLDAADADARAKAAAGVWLLLDDEHGVAASLADELRSAGGSPIVVRAGETFGRDGATATIDPLSADDYRKLISEAQAEGAKLAGVVHLWSAAAPQLSLDAADDVLVRSRALGCGSALKLIQSLARHGGAKPPKLWLVTRGAQEVTSSDKNFTPGQASLWGLGRVAAMEHPELKVHLVDLDMSDNVAALGIQLTHDLLEKSPENQLAYRSGQRYVARLQHAPKAIDSNGAATSELTIPGEGPCRLRLASAGSMDGLTVEPFLRQAPPQGHVEIEVRATGLNFSDVLKAMGLYPGIKDDVVPMGIECGGIVTRVGEGVDRFQVGDEVMGVAPYSFATHAITTEYAIVHKPKSLDFEEAATVPITFLTAYYALVRLAQVQPGERVLIHAGAGGVGLAAIQICKHLGAEIFVTAGSQSKHEYLRTLGVDHIYSSRTLDFAEQILADTNREGVDVVLNSLPGEAIPKSLGILRAYGRFLEIGKTDIYSNRMIGLEPFQDNLSYFAIDLDRMLRQRPDYIRTMFAEMMQLFEDGICRPLPLIQFTFAEIRDSFRFMAQRKNVGKVVVSVSDRPVQTAKVETKRAKIGDDGTYLITGGLGALGLRLADWLGTRGGKYVALMSRRGPDVATASTIAALEQKGLSVAVVQGDVANAASLRGALKQIPKYYPPLRGVVHAAGVLDDGILFDMDLTKLDKAMQPKVRGAWNLHTETLDSPLDFFVLFSSIAAVFGSPGQANYAAGNAFLDGLAAYRRGQGLPALAIAWGPWADAGMAATAGRDEGLASRGMELLPAQQALDLFGDLLKADNRSHVAVLSAHWHDLLAQYRLGVPPLLTQLAAEAETEGDAKVDEVDHALRAQLVAAELGERTKLLVDYFAQQLAKIMGLPASDLQLEQPLNTMGLDSLMAIELKNTVETKLAVSIPMATFMEGPSVTTLAGDVAELLVEGDEASSEADEVRISPNAGSATPIVDEQSLQTV
jgi:NADPH:quinone reductase-like Zn-dependent oxidoreductase/short-subunit dehydrogenase/acyl carrier protein